MSLPKISITFKEAANTFIARSQKGTLAVILKDSGEDSGIYELFHEGDVSEKLTEENRKCIERAFHGAAMKPKKIYVCLIGADAENYSQALKTLETVKIDYISPGPDATVEEIEEICEWIKSEREAGHYVKAVLPGVEADCEGIINFANTTIKSKKETFTPTQFCSRIAGLLCGVPVTQSSTYSVLEEIEEVDSYTRGELQQAVEGGKFVLFHDGEKVKVASGVTSQTGKEGKIQAFKKIKIVEAADMIRYDIKKTAEDRYIGKFANTYDNKCVLIVAINEYFDELEKEGIVKSGAECSIDVEAQRKYLISCGADVSEMSEQEIKEADTGEYVFLKADAKILDAIENISLDITI